MQQPTHYRLHLRDAHDAHTVFEAVRQGILTPVARRLNEMERSSLIRSGTVFVWFQAEDDTGLMRWTDGRAWGQSRMQEPYLFYDEKAPYDASWAANDTGRDTTYRIKDGTPRSGPDSSKVSHFDPTTHHHSRLVKQAYSAWVTVSPNTRPQRWHITAYFTYADLTQLPTVEHDPVLQEIIVPSGIYRSWHNRTGGDSGSDRGDEDAYNIRPGTAESTQTPGHLEDPSNVSEELAANMYSSYNLNQPPAATVSLEFIDKIPEIPPSPQIISVDLYSLQEVHTLL